MSSARIRALVADIHALSVDERDGLLQELTPLFAGLASDPTSFPENVHTVRSRDGMKCPHCAGTQLQRWGMARGKQRYRCVSCLKTFTDLTGTIFSGTHYPERWQKVLPHFVDGSSLATIARHVGVHISTAFRWRHLHLAALRRWRDVSLSGMVEADETFLPFSEKGKHLIGRPGRKRGETAPSRGISHHLACVAVVRDRHGHTLADYVGTGPLTYSRAKMLIGSALPSDAVLLPDGAAAYPAIARTYGVTHHVVPAKPDHRRKEASHHIQSVNGFHSRFKKWLARFNGVATKYLGNYVAWFTHLDRVSAFTFPDATESIVVRAVAA